jgi:class 3 adenylate cyclase/tetratricopeptide (TPR) repeat protein
MIICPRCGRDNTPDSSYCLECGAGLNRTCAFCGRELAAPAKFCTRCGNLAGGTLVAGAAVAHPGYPSPEAYTPKHLAEKIRSSKASLEGERKQISVMFADMKGSLELVADRDPEEAWAILDPVLQLMMDAVHRYEGTVNQVMGDGIMALFGAPVAHEDHAVRACYAALSMQQQVAAYSDELRRSGASPVQLRIGIDSGEVVVRSVSSELRMDYSAIGQTTHVAARMEQAAAPGTILITGDTMRLAEGYVEVNRLGPISVRGLVAPVAAYEVLGRGAIRSRFDAAIARGLTQFVGRSRELDLLQDVLERVARGDGQLVALVGQPGVGKSRLALELTRSDAARGWVVLKGSAEPHGASTPYLPAVNLLRAYFRIESGGDTSRTVREKVTEKLSQRLLAVDRTRSPLLALLDVHVADPEWAALDPPARRRRTLEALTTLLLPDGAAQPVLLVFEDLQWIDSETEALLDSLVERLPGARALLVVTYRPEYHHVWGTRPSYTELRIAPLPPETAEELADVLLGEGPQLDRLKRFLIARTGGNPFFLEESVRTLVETGTLTGHRGAYRVTGELASIPVPPTVDAVLAARIDRLPEAEKHLLQSAAVIGADVPLPLLRAVAGQSDQGLRRGLLQLEASEFLYETTGSHQPHYSFKHALTQEVAYSALLHEQRRVLHARIVRAIEEIYRGRVADQVDRLAHHAFRGELWREAVGLLHEAGRRAAWRSASREALAQFENALTALQHVPESRETLELGVDIRFDVQSACVPLGELDRMLGYLRQAEQLAQTLGDQRRLGRVFAVLAHYFWWVGELDRAVESGRRALTIAAILGDSELEMVANVRLGQAHYSLGQYEQTVVVCRACLAVLKGDLMRQGFGLPVMPAVVSFAFMGRSQAILGDFEAGLATVDEAIRVAGLAGQTYSLVFAHWASGDTYRMRGDLVRATAALERARALSNGESFALMAPLVDHALGETYALLGRHEEALGLLHGAVEKLTAMKFIPSLSLAYIGLSDGLRLAGRLDVALAGAKHARDLCRTHRQRGNEAHALCVLGEIYGALDDAAPGTQALREALTLAQAVGNRSLIGRCELGLGRLSRKTRDRAGAERHTGAALVTFQSLGMFLWEEEAMAELAAVRAENH